MEHSKSIVVVNAQSGSPVEQEKVPLRQKKVYLKAAGNFSNRKDVTNFYDSLDGKAWVKNGASLKMACTIPHFMGYRFGLFNYATKTHGGQVDFDFFRIQHQITAVE
ncbi:beta-xylosidase family glycoside hydrolase [Pontibacter rugosus]|uniref:Beta-xylosidase C-terminal Concanavalin A-like domain-containing protein n=1 Tax=Pontibacter rugosus TaxID=1745966 RepID=A0ABW3SS80_9BACT